MADRNDDHPADDTEAFRAAMNGVKPLKTDRVVHPRRRSKLNPREHARADEIRTDPITDSAPEDHALGAFDRSLYARPGVQQRVVRRLSRGQFPVVAELDLHGMTLREAKPRVLEFLEETRGEGMCCVRIVHGKGLSSQQAKPVLKNQLDHWLRQLQEVLAFSSALPHAGGAGALNVLLRRR